MVLPNTTSMRLIGRRLLRCLSLIKTCASQYGTLSHLVKPRGGLFLWVTTPATSALSSCFTRPSERVPLYQVFVPPDQRISSSMRPCYSFEHQSAFTRAIRRLSLCVQDRALYRAFLEAGLPESSHSESQSSAKGVLSMAKVAVIMGGASFERNFSQKWNSCL